MLNRLTSAFTTMYNYVMLSSLPPSQLLKQTIVFEIIYSRSCCYFDIKCPKKGFFLVNDNRELKRLLTPPFHSFSVQ